MKNKIEKCVRRRIPEHMFIYWDGTKRSYNKFKKLLPHSYFTKSKQGNIITFMCNPDDDTDVTDTAYENYYIVFEDEHIISLSEKTFNHYFKIVK